MLNAAQRLGVKVGVVVSLLVALLLAIDLAPKHREYMGKEDASAQPFQALVPAILGFRQLAASLLWVRTDDYFHRGEYKPILRLVKLITTIDPHQIDVYATGAWHMAYNFMDKRLIPEGIKFLAEGTKNNPTVYDLFFEAGYTNMDKTKDYFAAIDWYSQAITKMTTEGKDRPMYVDFQRGHAFERAGDLDRALAQWEANLKRAEAIRKEKPKEFASQANHDVAFNNLKMTKWRINDRKDLASEPVNLRFDYTVTRVAARKLLIEGKINALDYSRVRVEFKDKDYEALLAKNGIDWCMANLTREWESVQVRGGKFRWTLDLNKDPADMGRLPSEIYPVKSEEFELTVEFNPRTQAVFIQDRYGWSGEGLTDSRYLVTDDTRTGVIDGKPRPLRFVRKSVMLRKAQVL